jgi:multicomponent Na+:H+ antiporter subunit D
MISTNEIFMTLLPILPIIIPLFAAAVAVIALQKIRIQIWCGISGSFGILLSSILLFTKVLRSGPIVYQIGEWNFPLGITLVADLLSCILIAIVGFIGTIICVYSADGLDSYRKLKGFYPLVLFLLAGTSGAFLTGDLFNLYVWFEVLLIASFVLMVLGGAHKQIIGGIRYVIINLVASTMLLISIGLIYAETGTVNMADLSVIYNNSGYEELKTINALLLLFSFGIKSAIFPLFFWLPDSYPNPPPAISAFFAALLTKIGLYAMLRVFTLIFPLSRNLQILVLVIAGLTMITGVLCAISQTEVLRLLSFHIISQIGYIMMGLGIFKEQAVSAGIFFIVHIMLSKCALFLVGGIMHHQSGTTVLINSGGLLRNSPACAILFILPALSLAGIPPLSGFISKTAIISSGVQSHYWIMIFIALAVSLLTLYSMSKIWVEAFWRPASSMHNLKPIPISMLFSTGVLSISVLIMGILAGPLLSITDRAAVELFDRSIYIKAVMP